jgi:hypothetical protein
MTRHLLRGEESAGQADPVFPARLAWYPVLRAEERVPPSRTRLTRARKFNLDEAR